MSFLAQSHVPFCWLALAALACAPADGVSGADGVAGASGPAARPKSRVEATEGSPREAHRSELGAEFEAGVDASGALGPRESGRGLRGSSGARRFDAREARTSREAGASSSERRSGSTAGDEGATAESEAAASRSARDLAPDSSRSAGDVALLIGLERYAQPSRGRVPDLPGVPNDLDAMRWALTNRWGFAPEAVLELRDERATLDGIARAFEHELLTRARPGARLLIYFAGHGSRVPDVGGAEFAGMDSSWLAYDSRAGDRDGEWDLTDDLLGSWLTEFVRRGALPIVVVDACHSGGGTRGLEPLDRRSEAREAAARSPEVESAFARRARFVGAGTRAPDRARLASWLPPGVALLEDAAAPGDEPPWLSIAASGPDQLAHEDWRPRLPGQRSGARQPQGVFTWQFVRHLRVAPPSCSLDELVRAAGLGLRDEGYDQRPSIEGPGERPWRAAAGEPPWTAAEDELARRAAGGTPPTGRGVQGSSHLRTEIPRRLLGFERADRGLAHGDRTGDRIATKLDRAAAKLDRAATGFAAKRSGGRHVHVPGGGLFGLRVGAWLEVVDALDGQSLGFALVSREAGGSVLATVIAPEGDSPLASAATGALRVIEQAPPPVWDLALLSAIASTKEGAALLAWAFGSPQRVDLPWLAADEWARDLSRRNALLASVTYSADERDAPVRAHFEAATDRDLRELGAQSEEFVLLEPERSDDSGAEAEQTLEWRENGLVVLVVGLTTAEPAHLAVLSCERGGSIQQCWPEHRSSQRLEPGRVQRIPLVPSRPRGSSSLRDDYLIYVSREPLEVSANERRPYERSWRPAPTGAVRSAASVSRDSVTRLTLRITCGD